MESIYYIIFKWCIFSFGFVIGIFGNILVILATLKHKTLQISTNAFVCNLCASDIMILIAGLPLYGMQDRHFFAGKFKCQLLKPLLIVLITANVLTLVTIAIERYLIVIYPAKVAGKMSYKKSFLLCIVVDLIAIALGSPTLITQTKNKFGLCVSGLSEASSIIYTVALFIIQYAGPLITMTCLYFQMWNKIRRKNRTTIQIFSKNRSSSGKVRAFSDPREMLMSDCKMVHRQTENTDLRTDYKLWNMKRLSRSHSNLKEIEDIPSLKSTSTFNKDHLENLSSSMRSIEGNINRKINISPRVSRSQSMVSYSEINKCSFHSSSLARSASSDSIAIRKSDITLARGDSRGELFPRDNLFRNSMRRMRHSLTSIIAGTEWAEITESIAIGRYKQTLKTLKVFLILLIVFCLCMLPHHIIEILVIFHVHLSQRTYLFNSLIYCNAAINPWLYGGMNKQFQLAFKKLFKTKKKLDENEHPQISSNENARKPNIFKKVFLNFFSNRQKGRKSKATVYSSVRKMSRHSLNSINFNDSRKLFCTPIIIVTCYEDDIASPFV